MLTILLKTMTMLTLLRDAGEEGGKPERDAPVYGQQERIHCQDKGKHRVGDFVDVDNGDIGVGDVDNGA